MSRSVARAYYQFLGASALVQQRRAEHRGGRRTTRGTSTTAERRGRDGSRLRARCRRASRARSRTWRTHALGVALSARALETLSGLSPEPPAETPSRGRPAHGGPARRLAGAGAERPSHAGRSATQRDAAEQNRKATRARRPADARRRRRRSASRTRRVLRAAHQLHAAAHARRGASTTRCSRQSRRRLRRSRRSKCGSSAPSVPPRTPPSRPISACRRASPRAAQRALSSKRPSAPPTLSVDRYEIGVATQLDVTQAQREAFLAAAALIQADADLRLRARGAASGRRRAAIHHERPAGAER